MISPSKIEFEKGQMLGIKVEENLRLGRTKGRNGKKGGLPKPPLRYLPRKDKKGRLRKYTKEYQVYSVTYLKRTLKNRGQVPKAYFLSMCQAQGYVGSSTVQKNAPRANEQF